MSPLSASIEAVVDRCVAAVGGHADPELVAQLRTGLDIRFGQRSQPLGNTYLKPFEVPQIVLFDVLANRFPLVVESQRLVADLFLRCAQGHRHLFLLDIGIGSGVQAAFFLRELARCKDLLSVTLVGTDLLADALAACTGRLEALAADLPYRLRFVPVHCPTEKLDFDAIRSLVPADATCRLCNASLTLHHLQQADERQVFFDRLSQLCPDVFTVIEPDADGFTDDFDRRLLQVFRHFNALYRFVGTLDLASAEKSALKTFFARDFLDPVAFPDAHRYEKLQPAGDWLRYAAKAGFKPFDRRALPAPRPIPGIRTFFHPAGHFGFHFRGVRLLTVLALHLK